MTYADYIKKAVNVLGILVFVTIVLLAVPGIYNMYVLVKKSRNEKDNTKYAFDELGYDKSGNADYISKICGGIIILVIVFGIVRIGLYGIK